MKRAMKPRDLAATQVMTPSHVTNQMLDLLDPSCFLEESTYFLEPSCGDGQMLQCIVERIYTARLTVHAGNTEMALADTLTKFYAIDLDGEMVKKARHRIYEWAKGKVNRELSPLEMYLIARMLQRSIEQKDFFELAKEWQGGHA